MLREPRGLIQLVAGTQIAIAEVLTLAEFSDGNLPEARAQANGDPRFAMNAERLAISAKPIGIILLPTVAPTDALTSLLKYWTEIT